MHEVPWPLNEVLKALLLYAVSGRAPKLTVSASPASNQVMALTEQVNRATYNLFMKELSILFTLASDLETTR